MFGLFIELFEEAAAKLRNANGPVQGTIHPGVIESAGAKTGKAHLITSHHNVASRPAEMNLELIDPLLQVSTG